MGFVKRNSHGQLYNDSCYDVAGLIPETFAVLSVCVCVAISHQHNSTLNTLPTGMVEILLSDTSQNQAVYGAVSVFQELCTYHIHPAISKYPSEILNYTQMPTTNLFCLKQFRLHQEIFTLFPFKPLDVLLLHLGKDIQLSIIPPLKVLCSRTKQKRKDIESKQKRTRTTSDCPACGADSWLQDKEGLIHVAEHCKCAPVV